MKVSQLKSLLIGVATLFLSLGVSLSANASYYDGYSSVNEFKFSKKHRHYFERKHHFVKRLHNNKKHRHHDWWNQHDNGFRQSVNLVDVAPGLQYHYFHEKTFPFNHFRFSHIKSGLIDQPSTQMREADNGYLVSFKGFVFVPQTDEYEFAVNSGAEYQLYVGNKLVNEDIDLGFWQANTGRKVKLEYGYHYFELWQLVYNEQHQLKVTMTSPQTGSFQLNEQSFVHRMKHYDFQHAISLNQPDKIVSGIRYKYFEKKDPSDTNLKRGYHPIKPGVIDSIQLNLVDHPDHYRIKYEGYIEVAETALYTFYVTSKDHAILKIHGKEIVNNSGTHAAQERAGSILLEAGSHKFKLNYLNGVGPGQLSMSYSMVGNNGLLQTKVVTPSNLYSAKKMKGKRVEPITVEGNLVPGVDYDYFEGTESELEDLDNLTPIKSLTASEMDLSERQRENDFAFQYKGYIDIPEEGHYTFYLDGEGYSIISIAGKKVVKKNKNQKYVQTKTILLGAGLHQLEVIHKQYDKPVDFLLNVSSNNYPYQPIPAAWLKRVSDDQGPIDSDGDGYPDDEDAFPNDPNEWADLDDDGEGDNSDPDIDGDQYLNEDDKFPRNPLEWADLDGDGIGDNSDLDRDGDEYDNLVDAFPNDPTEWADLDDDGKGDNSDPDIDGDEVLNEDDAFPRDPTEWSDLDTDGIGDNSDLDRDGDMVENDQDFYPNDRTRWDLEVVTQFEIQKDNEQLKLVWEAVRIDSIVATYAIYRADFNGTETLIQTVANDVTEFVDSQVDNKKAYQYYIKSQTEDARESEPTATLSEFVAYNNDAVTDVNGTQTNEGILLTWQTQNADNTLVYRAQKGYALNLVTETELKQWNDVNTIAGNRYQYQVVNRKTFSNPINGNIFFIDGPASAIKEIFLAETLHIRLNATKVSSDAYELLVANVEKVKVTGRHDNAGGVVAMSLTNGEQTIEAQSQNGIFEIELPVAGAKVWSFTSLSSSEGSVQQASATLTLLVDEIAPQLTTDQPSIIDTLENSVTLTGTATDDRKLESLKLTSSQYGTQLFNAIVQNDGRYSIDVPIKVGKNTLALTAKDSANNETSIQIIVNKEDTLKPKIQITSHSNQQVVTTDSVVFKGTISSALPMEQIQLTLGAIQATLKPQSENVFSFELAPITLSLGYNSFVFRATSPAGETALPFDLTYEESVSDQPPVLSILAPLAGSFIKDDTFILQGKIISESAVTLLTIDGNTGHLIPLSNETYQFNYPAHFTQGNPTLTLAVKVIAENGEMVEQSFTYHRDAQSPTLTLNGNYQDAPNVTPVNDNPLTLSGHVTDDNISSLTLNGQAVPLTPSSVSDQYDFAVDVNVLNQTDTELQLLAYDLSGNVTSKTIIVNADTSATIDVIAPTGNTEFISKGTQFELQIIARINGMQEGDKARITLDQNTPIFVDVNETLLNTNLMITANTGEHQLVVEVLDANNARLTAVTRKFSLMNEADIPLELVRTEPYNGQDNVEPNGFVALYFNKPIDTSLISFDVRETAVGKTYVNEDPLGTSFVHAKGYQLKDVSRTNEVVPGNLGLVPGDNIVTYYPARDLAYGSSVFVTATYNGEELSRFNFTVRKLPTFLSGVVQDQLNQHVVGMKVAIPELNRETITNEDGVFAFGYGDEAGEALSGGNYTLVVNPNMSDPRYGIGERSLTVEQSVRNEVGVIHVPILSDEIPFQPIRSGQSALLSSGEMVLDLTQASLNFPDGDNKGNVHISFASISSIDAKVTQVAYPSWVYAIQPMGIKVSGSPKLEIKMPKLYNSYAYVPANGTKVVIVGRSSTNNSLVPVGVGKIDGLTVKSEGRLELNRLDYIGYALVPEDKQPALQKYIDGTISIQILIGLLQN